MSHICREGGIWYVDLPQNTALLCSTGILRRVAALGGHLLEYHTEFTGERTNILQGPVP